MRRLVGSACVAVVVAGAVSFGCESGARRGGGDAIDVALAGPPPPAPGGVVVEAALHDPDAMWSRLQHGASGALALLPPALGELASGLLGIDDDLGALVDGHATSYAVVAQRPGARDGDLAWALALRLTDDGAKRVATRSFDAGASGWSERVDGALRVLTRPDRPLPVALAIAPGWLVVARDEPALVAMAPYVSRTMPAGAALAGPAFVAIAPHAALAGPIAHYLSAQWAEARAWLLERDRRDRALHGGRPPDFGDPEALVAALGAAVERRVAALATASELRVELDAGDADLTLELLATPGAPGAVAAGDAGISPVGLGDARPLTEVPANAPLALLWRDEPEARLEDSRDLTALLVEFLGGRLREDQARSIGAALEEWSRGRGDWMSVAIAGSGSGGGARGLWIRAPASTREGTSQAVRDVLELSRLPPVRAPLDDLFHLGPLAFGRAAGNVRIATFAPPEPPGRAAGASREGVAWSVAAGDVTVAAGAEPLGLLTEATSRTGTWGDDARMARALAAVGDSAAFVALARPLRFGGRGAGGAGGSGAGETGAPLVVAWGRRLGRPWARVDLADELLTEGVRLGAPLF